MPRSRPVISYAIGSPADAREIIRRLTARFRTRREGRSVAKHVYYDTFDWRVYRNSGVLSADRDNGTWQLRWTDLAGHSRHRSIVSKLPEFARDLEPGRFRAELARVAEMRRLLPVARVESRGERFSVLDRRDKIVVRVCLDRGSVFGESSTGRRIPARLRVEGLTGYDRARDSVLRFLEREIGLDRLEGGELELALGAIGRTPGAYSAKLNLKLDPELRSDRATRRILARLFEILLANEDGMNRDLDSEFLHDFRVAVRRSRSCLGQIKGVFGAEATRHFAGEFAWLGKVTGPTRDLDVYLLQFDDYLAELPQESRQDLEPLAGYLRKRQRESQRRQTQELETARFTKLKQAWSAFLAADVDEDAPNAARPIRELAAERIERSYARVRKQGSKLKAESPAEAVHRLRISCKKLRYLLEVFRGLFDAEGVKRVIRSLKRLQDDLGDFNDLQIQQRDLGVMAGEMVKEDAVGSGTLLAMGRLIDRLELRQSEVRRRLDADVLGFVNPRTSSAIKKLLS